MHIANTVEIQVRAFKEMLPLWQEDPMRRSHVEQRFRIPWEDIPVACGFRRSSQTGRPRISTNGKRRRLVGKDRLEQESNYAKCSAWASECGLSNEEFRTLLQTTESQSDCRKRTISQLPYFLRSFHCSSWEHARLLCVNASIRKAAADAGRKLGGEMVATQATEEISQLLSSQLIELED